MNKSLPYDIAPSGPSSLGHQGRLKLLFISYYFPPTKSIACVRAYNVCYELLKKFKVWVFTTSNTTKFLSDQYPQLQIESKTMLRTFDLRTFIPQKPVRNKMNRKGVSLVFKLLWSFPLNLIIGIGGLVYIYNGYQKGKKLIEKVGITHLYSSFYPYSDHYIAYLLKKKYPDLVWVADFRDLHLDGKHIVWPKMQERWNRRILKYADIVTTVSKGLKQELDKLHPNVQVVRNGIGALNESISNSIKQTNTDKFIINYTGSLIPNISFPEQLLVAIQNLLHSSPSLKDQILIRYAGFHNMEWGEKIKNYHLEEVAETNGILPIQEAYKMQLDANINLLLTASWEGNRGILTGKFYEYLTAGKPILVLIKGDKDEEFEQMMKELQSGIVVYHDDPNAVNKIMGFIMQLFDQWQSGTLDKFAYTDKIKEYTIEHQLKQLLSLL